MKGPRFTLFSRLKIGFDKHLMQQHILGIGFHESMAFSAGSNVFAGLQQAFSQSHTDLVVLRLQLEQSGIGR